MAANLRLCMSAARPLPTQCAYTSLRKPISPIVQQLRNASVRKRRPSDPQYVPRGSTGTPHQQKAKKPLISGRVRFIIGSLFLGSIIYSMATSPLQPVYKPDHNKPDQLETVSIADLDNRRKRESGITAESPMRLRMEAFIKEHQDKIVAALQALEPKARFKKDEWTRSAGGGGISCVLQDGDVFEKAGVNISVVYGTLQRAAIQRMRVNHKALDDPSIESLEFFAAGLSLVLHPTNPNAPTVHLNYRYFETMDKSGEGKAWWFGGGTDLTPSYLYDEDAIHFHKTIKEACDRHGKGYYPRFKQWCDKYFRLPHRNEARGVGGIFFDDLDEQENSQEELFSFVQDSLSAFLPSYLPIINRRKDMPYGEKEKAWQQLRRGRYVEFNLVHDRGTAFGLNTPGARVESILMSLPLTARWEYMHEPEKGGREEKVLEVLREPREWV